MEPSKLILLVRAAPPGGKDLWGEGASRFINPFTLPSSIQGRLGFRMQMKVVTRRRTGQGRPQPAPVGGWGLSLQLLGPSTSGNRRWLCFVLVARVRLGEREGSLSSDSPTCTFQGIYSASLCADRETGPSERKA